ncbi:PE family protein [Mycolicibacter engbaekii]|uniref:PE family protein n=1 Tax=Mycolicibacter engbaekii TaxID=188915 RepID=A0A1X1U1Z6_9MYCO|nr:PE family protein [Mycolicibacter engbaekii]ORV50860.1 PE family protein [Mycolicibacter engbaekii]
MTFVTAQTEELRTAADSLSAAGLALAAQNAAAQVPTTGVVPPSADEVSATTAARFAAQALMYQQISSQATAIHEMFVATLVASSDSYAAAEAANALAAG